MAESDGELAARVEAKATKLVEQRDAEVDAARGRCKNDEAEYTKAKVKQLKETVSNDEEGIRLAQRRFERELDSELASRSQP